MASDVNSLFLQPHNKNRNQLGHDETNSGLEKTAVLCAEALYVTALPQVNILILPAI